MCKSFCHFFNNVFVKRQTSKVKRKKINYYISHFTPSARRVFDVSLHFSALRFCHSIRNKINKHKKPIYFPLKQIQKSR